MSVSLILQGMIQPTGIIPVVGSYTNAEQLNARFGKSNIDQWASFNSEELDENAIGAAIEDAEAYINDALRGKRYAVPFTGTIPSTIKRIATLLAGVYLYEARGVIDTDPDIGSPEHRLHNHYKMAIRLLDNIRAGKLKLDVDTATDTVYVPELETENATIYNV